MNRAISLWLAMMMLAGAMIVLPNGATDEASAAEIITAEPTGSGMEWYDAATYSDCLAGISGTHTTSLDMLIATGQYWNDPPSRYNIYRGAVAFDASAIDTSEVTSVTFNIKVNWTAYTGAIPDGHIDVYTRPASEASFNWTNLKTNMTYIGNLGELTDLQNQTWHAITVPKASLSTADWSAEYGAGIDTVFYLVSSREGIAPTVLEEYVVFSHGTIDEPYLSVTTIQNGQGTVRYWSDATTYDDFDILPVERMAFNARYDMLRYEVYVMNYTFWGFDWMTLYIDPSLEFLAAHMHATVDDLGGGAWNITDYWGDSGTPDFPPYYLCLWFAVPLEPQETEVYIQLWHSTLGEGFIWEKFKVTANIGTSYNNSTASRLVASPSYLLRDNTYTFAVMDYFNNVITTKTVALSGARVDILIPVPVYSVTFNSFRNDTTAVAIYFNSTGTPWQEHVSGGREVKMAVREGEYMFRFDYLASNVTGFYSVIATYFYNLTINATHTINIGTDSIGIIATSITGININVANIATGLSPSIQNIYYLLPEYPYGGTKAGTSLTGDESIFVAYHPYHILDASIRVNGTGTNVSLTDNRPTNGTVRWVNDILYINAYPYTRIFVNDSGGNVVNFTTAPAYLDLTDYSLGNITVWANSTISVSRASNFRQVRILTYQYYPHNSLYTTSAAAYNPSAEQWRNMFWYIGFATDTGGDILPADLSTIRLYDVDNAVVLQAGAHFEIMNTGTLAYFTYFNSTVDRTMQLSYYLDNATAPLSMPIITIRSYAIEQYDGHSYYAGVGTWVNNATAPYSGGMYLSLKNLGGTIDPNDIIIVDTTRDLVVFEDFYTVSGGTITLSDTIVGTIEVGQMRSFKIYFTYSDQEPEEFFLFSASWRIGWVELNAHLLILVGAFVTGGYGVSEFVTARRKGDEAKGFSWIIIGTFMFLAYLALWIWHTMGVL